MKRNTIISIFCVIIILISGISFIVNGDSKKIIKESPLFIIKNNKNKDIILDVDYVGKGKTQSLSFSKNIFDFYLLFLSGENLELLLKLEKIIKKNPYMLTEIFEGKIPVEIKGLVERIKINFDGNNILDKKTPTSDCTLESDCETMYMYPTCSPVKCADSCIQQWIFLSLYTMIFIVGILFLFTYPFIALAATLNNQCYYGTIKDGVLW